MLAFHLLKLNWLCNDWDIIERWGSVIGRWLMDEWISWGDGIEMVDKWLRYWTAMTNIYWSRDRTDLSLWRHEFCVCCQVTSRSFHCQMIGRWLKGDWAIIGRKFSDDCKRWLTNYWHQIERLVLEITWPIQEQEVRHDKVTHWWKDVDYCSYTELSV